MVKPSSDEKLDKSAGQTEEMETFCRQCKYEGAEPKGTTVNLKKLVYILSFLCILSICANIISVVAFILHGRTVVPDSNNDAGHFIDNFETAQQRHYGMNSGVQGDKLVQEPNDVVTESINSETIKPGEPESQIDDEHAQHNDRRNSHDGGKRIDCLCLKLEEVIEKVDQMQETFMVRVQSLISEQTSKKPQPIVNSTPKNELNNDIKPRREYGLIGKSRFTSPVTPEYIRTEMSRTDIRVDRRSKSKREWNGTLYSNRRFKTNAEAPITLKFFEDVNQADDDIERLFDLNNGVFTARVEGLYHIYAHIPYYNSDSGPVALKHQHYNSGRAGKVETVFGCTKSIDYHHNYVKKQSTGIDYSYRICTMAGSVVVEQGDRFWLHTVHPSAIFGLSKGDCYFGAFAYAL